MEHIKKQLYYRETWKRRIVFAQLFIALLLTLSYASILFQGVSETARIQSLTERADRQRLNYREQESLYFSMLNDVTLTYAYAHGFVEADAVSFVTLDGDTVARLSH